MGENLVDCDDLDKGCHGGWMDNAFEWVANNGICSEEDYPYSGEDGQCKDPKCQPVVRIKGFVDVPPGNEQALQAAVAKQPVSVAIQAKGVFQLYKRGIIDSPACGQKLDHGVVVVGYGAEDGKDFWKVKNSWGSNWGEDGYVRIARGTNMCGIAMRSSYPIGAESAGPSPGPGPSPSPPGPPPGRTHYENPKGGCQPGELALTIAGVKGSICAPHCSMFQKCPTDMPAGATAHPQCALTVPLLGKFCALICDITSNDQCGAQASCKKAGPGISVCTYDEVKTAGSEVDLDIVI